MQDQGWKQINVGIKILLSKEGDFMFDHNYIKINTNKLLSDANEIDALIRSIEKEKNDMEGNMKELFAMWDGTAKTAFVKAFTEDIKALEKCISSLRSMNQYEKNAQKKYENCEKQVDSLVDSIRI